jgi:hypothetical protein
MKRGNWYITVGMAIACAFAMTVAADDSVVSDGFPGVPGDRIEDPRPGAEQPSDAFGPNSIWKVISGIEFLPRESTTEFDFAGSGYYYHTTAGTITARVDLPIGSEVSQVCVFTYDNPGYEISCMLPDPNTLIHGWFDLDSDGDGAWIWYRLSYYSTAFDSSVRWGGGLVYYKRTISPAPVASSFPDVSTGYWAFQEIEALVAAGITTGFPDGTFRPTDPVTRAQMATFLARALGLHWPF